MKTIILLVTSIILLGCDKPTDPEVMRYNAAALKDGVTIGTLPDGRKLTLHYIKPGYGAVDRVYIVDGSITTISKSGKSKKTKVLIDDIIYVEQEQK